MSRIAVKSVAGLLLIGVAYYIADRANYWYRQQWHDVPWMHDLPPEDRSHWPKSPAAWSNETLTVNVATPEGTKSAAVTYYTDSIGLKLVRIEPGTFLMGLPDDVALAVHNLPPVGGPMYTQHKVTLTKRYYIGAFEVTNKQYDMFDPSHKQHRPAYQMDHDSDNEPVQPLTWQQAALFCRWLSEKEGRVYRLPTEAEWEYACRAGTTNRTYWGDKFDDRTKANVGGVGGKDLQQHWKDDGYVYTAPVGSYLPNPWGLYDMIGNAREWVNDWYGIFPTEPVVDPTGPPTGHNRVARSGSWNTALQGTSSAFRDGDAPHDAYDCNGFRIVCEVE
jgi:formylglycine-generating enzyme